MLFDFITFLVLLVDYVVVVIFCCFCFGFDIIYCFIAYDFMVGYSICMLLIFVGFSDLLCVDLAACCYLVVFMYLVSLDLLLLVDLNKLLFCYLLFSWFVVVYCFRVFSVFVDDCSFVFWLDLFAVSLLILICVFAWYDYFDLWVS